MRRWLQRISGIGHRCLALLCAVALLGGLFAAVVRADDWPQWLGPKRDGVWRETGILDTFPREGPRVLWRTPIGSGYAGPAVAGDRVFLMDRVLAEGTKNPPSGFTKDNLPGKERVLCLDESNGKVLWTHEYDCTYQLGYPSGPRATPTVSGGKVYTLGTMGDLRCLDANQGTLLWSKNFPADYKGKLGIWGAAAAPLVDGNKLICLVGGKDCIVMAFDKDSGKEIWRALSAAEPGYAAPVIYELAGKRQLIVWHPEAVVSLDPETGKVYWSQDFKLNSNSRMSISTPRADGNLLFVTSFYDGPLMLKVSTDKNDNPQASVLWKGKSKSEQPERTDGLHSIISTPFLKDGYIYGVCSYGELRCLKEDTGDRLWSTLKATTANDEPTRWANAFLVPQGDRFFLFNEKGDLIIARLTAKGYDEISRAHILEPTNTMAGRAVVWSHPAFADKCCFARNDKEIVCVSLAAEK
jgi:outer membrane protein assembly factor BamB